VFPAFRASQQTKYKAVAYLTIFVAAFLTINFLPGHGKTLGIERILATAQAAQDGPQTLSPISIDYPQNGSIFPPGITPPMFLWRDAAGTSWTIDVKFAGNAAPIHAEAKGERMKLGPIDPLCVADSNKPPKLTAQQAASWAWTPDAETWRAIQAGAVAGPATVVITGYRDGQLTRGRASN